MAEALARWRLTGEFAGDPVMLHRAATLHAPGGVLVLGGRPLIPPGEPVKPKLSRCREKKITPHGGSSKLSTRLVRVELKIGRRKKRGDWWIHSVWLGFGVHYLFAPVGGSVS